MPNKVERIVEEIKAISQTGYDIVDSVVAGYRTQSEVGPDLSLQLPYSWKTVLQLETDCDELTSWAQARNPRRIPTLIPLGTGAITEAPPHYELTEIIYVYDKPKEKPILGRPATFLELANVDLNLRRTVVHEQYGEGSVLSLAFLPSQEWSLDKSEPELPLGTHASNNFLEEVVSVLSNNGLEFVDQETKEVRARMVADEHYRELKLNLRRIYRFSKDKRPLDDFNIKIEPELLPESKYYE